MAPPTVKVIECPCGVILEGTSDDDVVGQAQTHARQNHDMTLSREEALSMARPS